MVRLIKDAPWDEVTLSNGKINKRDWSSDELDIEPIRIFIEYKDIIEATPEDVQTIMSDIEPSEDLKDLMDYSKAELVALAKDKGIDTKGLSKNQLVEKLNVPS